MCMINKPQEKDIIVLVYYTEFWNVRKYDERNYIINDIRNLLKVSCSRNFEVNVS
jgi:hypothetical protein